MLKKFLMVASVLILLGAVAWYYFGRSTSMPLGQTLSNLSPFGSGGDNTSGGNGSPTSSSTEFTNSSGAKTHLFKISDVPVAGATAIIKNGALVVRYVERGTGHVVDVDPQTLAKTQIVNITVPKVYEAAFNRSGSVVVFRTLRADGETIDSNTTTLIPPTGTSTTDLYTTKTSGLPANIMDLSAGSSTIFYTSKTLPQIITSLFDGTKPTSLFSAAFNEWRLTPSGDANLVITTKASSEANGYAYALNTKTAALTKLLGPLTALVVTPNATLSRIAYSFSNGESTVLATANLATGAVYAITPSTLAEKCLWSARTLGGIYCAIPSEGLSAGEPDQWYKGATHYTDRIWKFDTDKDFADVLADPKKDFNQDIDAENLFLSPSEDYLFFQNKRDLSLWALKLDSTTTPEL